MESGKLPDFLEGLDGPKAGALLGLFLGLVFSFNLPSFTGFIFQTLVFTAVFTALGFARTRYGWKAAIPVLLLILIGFLATATNMCNLMAVQHEPARNSFTGEVDASGGFDGLRLMQGCDKGEYPWYYESMREEEIDAYCSENSGSSYCAMEETRGTGIR